MRLVPGEGHEQRERYETGRDPESLNSSSRKEAFRGALKTKLVVSADRKNRSRSRLIWSQSNQ